MSELREIIEYLERRITDMDNTDFNEGTEDIFGAIANRSAAEEANADLTRFIKTLKSLEQGKGGGV